ncbi:hypothetical protein C7B61_01890 [filamentous cyanobacterium CCP1]|nr:hypothetical protein C7B76_22770 [filamentous cyanobacterium CCP2]PSB68247.1 hypothetical protein C7B61_01890 [filamentous cyanobacterium CCP1]
MTTKPQTYRAILQGSQITWIDIPPDLPPKTEIYVTVTHTTSNKANRGQAMAAALARLAQASPFSNIDPIVWQQETRQDRPLPGRE